MTTPTRPPRACARCGKPAVGICSCRPAWEGSTHPDLSHDRRYQKIRAAKLRNNPICEAINCFRLAVRVDHIIPIAEGGDRYSFSNLQSLCATHDKAKVAQDARRGKLRAR